MRHRAQVPVCPVCGFSSRYTDGDGPCSVRCALKLATHHHGSLSLPLDLALKVAREEAEFRGLPPEPHVRDIREPAYKYLWVSESYLSRYWKIDRALIQAGLNVEYTWVPGDRRSRIYRFAPCLVNLLPDFMLDYKLRPDAPKGGQIYWHFLKASQF